METENWTIDLNRIKMKEIKTCQDAWSKAIETGDFELFWTWAARIVISWPFESDPSITDNYSELGILDGKEVIRRITETFQRFTTPPSQVPESSVVGGEGSAAG